VLFDIPQGFMPLLMAIDGSRGVTGEWGTPYHPPTGGAKIGTQNLLWPFDIEQGNLILPEGGPGRPIDFWTGPVYDPVLEFDALARIYKRRNAQ
jgi:hypothetical protein